MNFLQTLTLILAAILIAMGINWLYFYIQGKRSAKVIDQETFRQGMRKAQVIDVREKKEFDGNHILGARNIPYTLLNNSIGSIRKDQPVYLYDTGKTLSVRAANKLRKNGYKDIYILKEGFNGWEGKKKSKKVS
ncbi:MAG: rhodanese-like domain-containing protein [Tetragenococcus halophilus]|uniref:rhodanese-like domain-containing protein n=1 Tax=Tetragenococcus halophilus TaxID=51669 RepID=UPI0019286910|nr:rhodanese-like domain-containing protein [Tetragenococcus halophilus]MCF1601900.1 rhodanese-like domain-containing protein [Tetragenococcus halophilus]MCF1675382.1 rhodanese-like domain-containing protein [Tetragenococcus halophilus]MCO8286498.1 rhodanese-like domain-containing protein [Tetragenococcus halophilus]MCO8291593.1 rhodanese-like domain-containing protein [Tetragenococcus halophilus]MCO8295904.1 rhodanese-like domain-containing protein [Tetragenococcus halophilus]